MARRKVVLVGAAGWVAGRMLPALRERYDLILIDVATVNRAGEEVEGVVEADLLDRERDAYRHHFRGADAVIHSGFVRGRPDESAYWAEADNVNMAHNIYETCLQEEVRRLVVMSSNHAADFYEPLVWQSKMEMVTPDMRPLSDNFYGWAKASYELLGFMFAASKGLQNVQLRIGGPRENDIDSCGADDLKRMHRALGAYLSVRDQVQLVVKSIETENIEDENGIPFQIFYGISGNTHRFWSIANARRVIGYEPEDDSQIRFADSVAQIIEEARGRAQTE